MRCENEVALQINWAEGDIMQLPCTNEATRMILDGFGFGYLCDECSERLIASKHLTLNISTSLDETN